MSFVATKSSIDKIIAELIKAGYSCDQNFPTTFEDGESRFIGFKNDNLMSIALSPVKYTNIYKELDEKRAFSIKLIDGALLQISYRFNKKTDNVESHRLAFFPRLDLIPWNEDTEIYERESLFADVLDGNIVHCPFRFDFNRNEKAEDHSMSHLTIGQIKDCRIPVICPISPGEFIDFVISNLYSKAKSKLPPDVYGSCLATEDLLQFQDRKKFHLYAPIRVK